MIDQRFTAAQRIADAVLYEGYMLYPYRKSALKNQLRWQFGVVQPRSSQPADENWLARSECIVERDGAGPATITAMLRFLQLQRRTVEVKAGGRWETRERVVVEGNEYLSWDEAVACDIARATMAVDASASFSFPFAIPGGRDEELVRDGSGDPVARVVRTREPLSFAVRVSAAAAGALVKLTIAVENLAHAPSPSDSRDDDPALGRALIGCHALMAVENGAFASLLDPPPHAVDAARSCAQHRWWPVLVGPEGSRDLMLCAPIILYDYPAVAPESAGDFFDATEIDELLTLRVMTMTEAEKREMAATDDRARRILERVDGAAPTATRELHGAVRAYGTQHPADPTAPAWEAFVNPPHLPAPEDAQVRVGTTSIGRGSRVRLAPRRSADAMDMFLVGRIATVAGVYHDLDERIHVAVTLDDDPSADLHRDLGRYFYFAPEELAPLEAGHD